MDFRYFSLLGLFFINRLTHQMAMTSRREILYWMRNYCVGYILLWLLLRLVFLFSRVTGWGNISGASALEYFRNLIAVSMFEKWAYLFVGVLMFAFIVSLFPLTVIAKTEHWVLYVLVDGAIFSLVCLVIEQIGYYFTKTKSSCVIDSLLLCNKMKAGQEAAWIFGIVLFALVVCVASYGYAVRRRDGPMRLPFRWRSVRNQFIKEKVLYTMWS